MKALTAQQAEVRVVATVPCDALGCIKGWLSEDVMCGACVGTGRRPKTEEEMGVPSMWPKYFAWLLFFGALLAFLYGMSGWAFYWGK